MQIIQQNHIIHNQQNMNQQNLLRHTISAGQIIPSQNNRHYVSVQGNNQQFNARGSLPANMVPPQYFKSQQIQNNKNVNIQLHNNQVSTNNVQNQNALNQPKSLSPINNFYRPIDFIQQGQERL